MEATDLAILERFRARLLNRRANLTRDATADGGARDAVLAAMRKQEVEVCVWCHHARVPGGPWQPVGHLLPPEDAPGVRRCICYACAGQLNA